MKTSKLLLATLREVPAEAEIISHQLMLRAGMIRKLTSGVYTWLPLGLRVLNRVSQVIRHEMARVGAEEILMPMVQPAELWVESQRWNSFGDQLLKFNDRHHHACCLGPTHEEVITDLIRDEVRSYKQLPLILYQIQTKFRDEIRPRFGVMRGREFLMKDAYSFHLDEGSLAATYDAMYQAYVNIFTALGLKFRAVLADTGNIGGNRSHEFQVLAEAGEDLIAYSDTSDYAANIEFAESEVESTESSIAEQPVRQISVGDDLQELDQLQIPRSARLKIILVKGAQVPVVALVLRADHEINWVKVARLKEVAQSLSVVESTMVPELAACAGGDLGPIGLKIPVIADRAAVQVKNFACSTNQKGSWWVQANWQRDLPLPQVADLRQVVAGDRSPDGQGFLQLARGIEVGQLFQLGTKYSCAMGATVLDQHSHSIPLQMGCYGIGVSRTVAAAIEQHHDERGIIWPEMMAPYQIVIVPMSWHKSYRVREVSEQVYRDLIAQGFEVLLDDRKERAGVLFADMDLIGIPHRLVISERGIDQGYAEYKLRSAPESTTVALEQLPQFMRERVVLRYNYGD